MDLLVNRITAHISVMGMYREWKEIECPEEHYV
jgi:hypothetical protein